MKASVEEVNSVQKRIKVSIASEAVSKAFDGVYGNLRKKAKINGFRPGKAPLSLIKKLYGHHAAHDVEEQLIKDSLYESLTKNDIQPIAAPFIEKSGHPKAGEEFNYSALVDILPAVELNSAHKDLEVACQEFIFTEKEIEDELRNVSLKHAKIGATLSNDAPCKKGLQATLKTVATYEGKSVDGLSNEKLECIVGEKQIRDEVDQAVIGMKTGESKSIQINLGQGENQKIYDMDITLTALNEVELPEINDELAKDLSFDSLDHLKTTIRNDFTKTCEQRSKAVLDDALLKALGEKVTMQVPPSITERFIDNTIDEMQFRDTKERDNARQNPKLRENLREQAQVKARNSFLLQQVIQEEKLEISDEELEGHIRGLLGDKEVKGEELKKIMQSYGDRMRETMLLDKALKKIASYAKVKLEPVNLWSTDK